MQKILRKRVLRDLKKNLFRYLALGFMIILGMYIIISLVGAADTIILGTAAKGQENLVEDGEFEVFVPLREETEETLTGKGITLERMFYLDFQAEDESTIRVYQNREAINLVDIEEGRTAEASDEIVLEKRYCEENGISVGDLITFAGTEYRVSGIGTAPDYEAPYRNLSDGIVDSKNFGIVFVCSETYESLLKGGKSAQSEEYVYAYRLNNSMTNDELKEELRMLSFDAADVDDVYFQEYWDKTAGKKDDLKNGISDLLSGSQELQDALGELTENNDTIKLVTMKEYAGAVDSYVNGVSEIYDGSQELADGLAELKDHTDELLDKYFNFDVGNMTSFITAEDNPRIGAAGDDQIINKLSGLAAGVIALILFTYVISVFVIHGIEEESSIIGTLYALGVKRRELMAHYLMLPVLITFIAGVIGTALGYSSLGVKTQMQDCYNYFSVPKLDIIYEAYVLVYGIVMPPVVAVIVNCLVIRKRLSVPALKLIRNEQKQAKIKELNLGKMSFVSKFRIRQMFRELRSSFTVWFGMFISMLILMLSINCYVLCEHVRVENVADTKFGYMYTYKYPEDEVPEGGEAAYAKALKKEILGYNLDVTLLGIDKENTYFEAIPSKSQSHVVISSAMAQKYGISIGDKVVLTDEEEDRDYAFTVEDIVQYQAGFYVFMDIDSMRELFGESDDYFNVVFSEKALDIPSGRLYATTTREEVEKSSNIFVKLMMPMVSSLSVISALIFVIVMYLMMKVMIDRSALNISLMKIFGYRTGEIRKLYLNGNFYMIAIGAAVAIPLSKVIMDAMYPYLVSNVAVGINLKFSWQLYVGIYAAVLVLYLVINQLLVGRLKKILPAEVLKNRE